MADAPRRRVYLIAGEASGDSHGAHLIDALTRLDPTLTFEGYGGVKMQAAGMRLEHDLAAEGIMGFVEVIKHAPRLRRMLLDTAARLRADPPAALVLIDYPGFNIRLAKLLEGSGIPVVYYISPQVWAWKKGRIHTLARVCRKMLVIFPFEERLYRDLGVDCTFVGHPIIEEFAHLHPHMTWDSSRMIGLLPGSRAQEISRLYPAMLEVARGMLKERPELIFVTPCTNLVREKQLRELAGDFPVEIVPGAMYDVLSSARFCLVASGTATLETAVFGVPMIILYRVSPLTYALARMLVDIKYIGMVNILAGRGIVPEYIQHAIRVSHILPQALSLIDDTPERAQMLRDLYEVREMLGGGGASERAAKEVLAVINSGHA
jgi:lipid-A-disaccharide synthase